MRDLKKYSLIYTFHINPFHRLGVQNCIIVNQNGTDFPKLLSGFDRVLLDAPCSGLGVISRDSTIKATRTTKDVIKNSVIQKKLILSAIDSVDCNSKTGGIIVYSTCSISVQENEMVVNYALRKRFVKLIDTELPFGNNGLTKYQSHHFHKSLNLTRRFYPHVLIYIYIIIISFFPSFFSLFILLFLSFFFYFFLDSQYWWIFCSKI